MPLIEARELAKRYRTSRRRKSLLGAMANLVVPRFEDVVAVDGLSFSIDRGEMVGFVGPNGAGKSTTVKILAGILHPTSGEVVVGGLVPYRDRKEHVRRIGAVFGQKSQLWWDLPVTESYEMLRHIYRVEKTAYEKRLKEAKDLLGLEAFMERPVRQLSLGQRMKADLGAALLHGPDILFLDEPTIGLDVVAKEAVRNFLVEVNRQSGLTMLLTTHDMQDIEKTCGRAIIIDKGRSVFDGSLRELRVLNPGKRELVVEFARDYGEIAVEGTSCARDSARVMRFSWKSGELAAQDLIARLNRDFEIADLTMREPEIEGIIRDIYAKGAAQDAGLR